MSVCVFGAGLLGKTWGSQLVAPHTLLVSMRRPWVVDQVSFLAQELSNVPKLRYFAPGKPEPMNDGR